MVGALPRIRSPGVTPTAHGGSLRVLAVGERLPTHRRPYDPNNTAVAPHTKWRGPRPNSFVQKGSAGELRVWRISSLSWFALPVQDHGRGMGFKRRGPDFYIPDGGRNIPTTSRDWIRQKGAGTPPTVARSSVTGRASLGRRRACQWTSPVGVHQSAA
jgi:hypothetical protein